ncbi:MAG: 16S rRNA (uracil(1498)-N(3))-methyltransferase [Cyanobacteria bacterium SBLK]|nr:16S rRNA (uracil(1498)-N(3))-methyltransferase [Cyanobacteria bacterium SBLK]
MSSQLQRVTISPQQRQDKTIALTYEQKHYLERVLRLKKGDRFIAMDGKGKGWLASLREGEAIAIEPFSFEEELKANLTLIVALPKGNGFDDIVRCCTELGVSTFVPTISDRVLLRPSPQKLIRWRRIATEAAEQSERAIVPVILEPQPFRSSLQTVQAKEKYICVARGKNPLLLSCLQRCEEKEIALLAGPEGGWTAREVEEANECGYTSVSLGSSILRAITAAIASVSLVAAIARSGSRYREGNAIAKYDEQSRLNVENVRE